MEHHRLIGQKPICLKCKHFNYDDDGATCTAFESFIPDDIYLNGDNHESLFLGQSVDVIFEEASKKELKRRGEI